jgi:hypothetical protein
MGFRRFGTLSDLGLLSRREDRKGTRPNAQPKNTRMHTCRSIRFAFLFIFITFSLIAAKCVPSAGPPTAHPLPPPLTHTAPSAVRVLEGLDLDLYLELALRIIKELLARPLQ